MHESPSQNILRVALAVPLRQLFDYLPPAGDIKARPGMRVIVPFGHLQMVGIIVELANQSEMPLDKLAAVLE
ncbi:MAG: hypothetical protein KJN61_09890, partial [Gammaproteobacteria bacterium]|nr:hypothetical protein [Gammaproteobacteria bacterium]